MNCKSGTQQIYAVII